MNFKINEAKKKYSRIDGNHEYLSYLYATRLLLLLSKGKIHQNKGKNNDEMYVMKQVNDQFRSRMDKLRNRIFLKDPLTQYIPIWIH